MSGTQQPPGAVRKHNTRGHAKSVSSIDASTGRMNDGVQQRDTSPNLNTSIRTRQKKNASHASVKSKSRKGKKSPENHAEDEVKEQTCAGCKGAVNEHVKALQCEFCAVWSCLVCTGVPEQVYDLDMENKIPGFVWTCNSCIHAIPTIKNLSQVLGGVKDEQLQCRSDINTLNTKVDKLENSIEDKVQQAVEEYRDRENRKFNIIVHQVPESSLQEAKDRNAEDTNIVNQLLADIGVQEATVSSVVRLGKRIPDRHRLMKVTLDSVPRKIQALRNAKKLQNTFKWKEVFITPDMTPKEREKNKLLRMELKRRRDAGEDHLVIRKGEIVKMEEGSFRRGSQHQSDHEADNSSSAEESSGEEEGAVAASDPFRD